MVVASLFRLCIVVGKVGSGKTTLINGILGELPCHAGSLTTRGSIAYVGQHAWILNTTIRENILFGRPYNAAKFQRVIQQCALEADLRILPAGVETEIGERGVTLSGGQKQRVSIARAIYSDRDIFIFDDCLSALDSHVGKHIFTQCILQALKGKTRILVTHALQFADRGDQIVVMDDLGIDRVGSFDDVMQHSQVFESLSRKVAVISLEKKESAVSDRNIIGIFTHARVTLTQ